MESNGSCSQTASNFMTTLLNYDKAVQLNQDNYSITVIFINVVLALTATLGNGMIIVAILRSQNLQTPSYLLITSLAFTDLLVGLLFHPTLILWNMTYSMKDRFKSICLLAEGILLVVFFLTGLSLVMVTCISIDRYLALTLRHRYTIIVTKKRVRLLIVSLWIGLLSMLTTWEEIFSPLFTFCSAMALVLLSITCVCYIKSFRALHLYTVQVHAQQANPLAGNFDVVRYKKTLKTMLVVLVCLLLCFLPAICSFLVMSFCGIFSISKLVLTVSICVMDLNSSVNPVIYLIRFADIRNACRERLLRTLKCSLH